MRLKLTDHEAEIVVMLAEIGVSYLQEQRHEYDMAATSARASLILNGGHVVTWEELEASIAVYGLVRLQVVVGAPNEAD